MMKETESPAYYRMRDLHSYLLNKAETSENQDKFDAYGHAAALLGAIIQGMEQRDKESLSGR